MTRPNEATLIERVKGRFGASVLEVSAAFGEVTYVVERDALVDVCLYLKHDPDMQFTYLSDISAADYLPREPRFEVAYHLMSPKKKRRVRVKVRAAEGETVPSVTSIWRAAGWPERENYDMFGIVFEGNSDLRRIFMPEDWKGFPLRKDYPLRGYKDDLNPYGEEEKE